MATTTETGMSFSNEEIAFQAIGNANSLALAHIARARMRGEPPDELGHWFGSIFAPTWNEVKAFGARGAARQAALSVVSLGAELQSFSGDDQRASATITGWPNPTVSAMFDLGPTDADAIYAVFAPIAAHLELNYRWERDGDAVTMTFSKRPR